MQGVWSDVHTILIGYIRDALGEELPEDLTARAEEGVSLSGPLDSDQSRRADVAVIEPEPWKRGEVSVWTPEGDPDLAGRLAKPVMVVIDEVVPRWVEIRSGNGRLITVIEVTSPANKTGDGRRLFEDKLLRFLQAGVSVMEIDLVRGGYGSRHYHPGTWPTEPSAIIVNRARCPGVVAVYPCPLREPLPAVRVPLRENEADAALDLQPLIERCYQLGRYWMLPYQDDPLPALPAEDLQWARNRLREAGVIK